ncbi:hypothetical protein DB346_05310 [Verrucomicrobia bacterium LW23]|nr:hypothetical protein DB346_05310 [Verrucomicrobia bacterium LW23]
MASTEPLSSTAPTLEAQLDSMPAQRNVVIDTALIFVTGLLLYVLSYGPVTMMYRTGILSTAAWHAQAAAMFYAPLELGKRVSVFNDAMKNYVEMWVGSAPVAAAAHK